MGFFGNQPAVLYMDNEAVVNNTIFSSSSLKKKHNDITYHQVKEAVATDTVKVAHVKSKNDRAFVST